MKFSVVKDEYASKGRLFLTKRNQQRTCIWKPGILFDCTSFIFSLNFNITWERWLWS